LPGARWTHQAVRPAVSCRQNRARGQERRNEIGDRPRRAVRRASRFFAGGSSLMPLFVPVLLIGAGVITGAGGAASAIRGGQKMRRAGRDAAQAGDRYRVELAETQEEAEATSVRLQAYGERQEEALQAGRSPHDRLHATPRPNGVRAGQ
jgi:hypothetical protein